MQNHILLSGDASSAPSSVHAKSGHVPDRHQQGKKQFNYKLNSALSMFANLATQKRPPGPCDNPHRHLRILSQESPSGLHNAGTDRCSQPRALTHSLNNNRLRERTTRGANLLLEDRYHSCQSFAAISTCNGRVPAAAVSSAAWTEPL